jgi:hypothetical protein
MSRTGKLAFFSAAALTVGTILHNGIQSYRRCQLISATHCQYCGKDNLKSDTTTETLEETEKVDEMSADGHDDNGDNQHDGKSQVVENDETDEEDGDAEAEKYLEKNFAAILSKVSVSKLTCAAHVLRVDQLQREKGRSLSIDEMLNARPLAMLPTCGSYNLAYRIRFPDGTAWYARLPGHGARFGPLDIKKMDNEYRTMRYIGDNSTIPVPEVIFWTTSSELIGTPFGIVSAIEGQPLFMEWDAMTKEERHVTLRDIASHMVKFRELKFDAIGMLDFSDGEEPSVGPMMSLRGTNLFDAVKDDTPFFEWCETREAGPFKTTESSYAPYWIDREGDKTSLVNEAGRQILRLAIETMPSALRDETQYCLKMPDLNWQNIFVDSEGKVTGFIDWDGVGTDASIAGYAQVPVVLCEDWNPAYYEYADGTGDDGHLAPSQLAGMRNYYSTVFAEMMEGHEDYDPRMTSLSHVVQAIDVAAVDEYSRQYVVSRKLLKVARVEFNLAQYCDDVIDENTLEKDAQLRAAFGRAWEEGWDESKVPEAEKGIANKAPH